MAVSTKLIQELFSNYREKAEEFGEWSEEAHKAWTRWAIASGELNRLGA